MRTALAIVLISMIAGAPSAPAQQDHADWKRADEAYRKGRTDDGNTLLQGLVESNPGDVDLAVRCLERILDAAASSDANNPWVRYASRRLAALERIGALPAEAPLAYRANAIEVARAQGQGRQLEVVESLDRLVAENPQKSSWKILRARTHRHLDTRRARQLFEELREIADPGHPDSDQRERWMGFEKELESDLDSLPQPIFEPLPNASPLVDAEPDDPDGRWRKVSDGSPLQIDIAREIDRLAGESFEPNQVVPWRDMSGLLDPPRALDLHLLSKPTEQLAQVRKEQAGNFSFEVVPDPPGEDDVLRLYRRYPWALPAQKLLLGLAHDYLWSGRTESARRCFQDLAAHSEDPQILDAVQVGMWLVLSQVGTKAELVTALEQADAEKQFPWMGKTASAKKILADLSLLKATPLPAATAPSIADFSQKVVRLPPVPPWPINQSDPGFGVDLQAFGQQLLVSGRNLLASYDIADTSAPVWAQLQRQPIEDRRASGFHPGYFRPLIASDGEKIYTRAGFGSVPGGIAAFDRASGEPLWASEPLADNRPRNAHRSRVPVGDPVPADGKLFFLQWNTNHNVNDARGRELALVCLDPAARTPLWETVVARSGNNSDLVGNLERASAAPAIYGNRVTVHDGAVYLNSNAGLIARCDVRDGRMEWIHYYRRANQVTRRQHGLGCAPIVAGDRLLCLPRDSGRVFALDLGTGRPLWDNPLTSAVECLGTADGSLILRGVDSFMGLDISNGQTRWFHPLDGAILGRAQRVGPWIYFAQAGGLRRIDAQGGSRLEERPWNLGEEGAIGFKLHGSELYIVSDQPAEDPTTKIAQALAPDAPEGTPALTLPPQRRWWLARRDAKIVLPETGSPLAGRAFVFSGGILECLDLTPRGGIQWQRFVVASGTNLKLIADRLLLIEGSAGPAGTQRTIAFGGIDGRILWDRSEIPHGLNQTLLCGSRLLFHDGRSRMAAIDLNTGELAWSRHFEIGQLLKPHWDGDGKSLHVFHTTLRRGASHLELDLGTGRIRSERGVEIKLVDGPSTNSRPLGDGYFEVAFAPVEARFIRLTTLSEINGREWASAAELQVAGADGKRLPRKGWTASTDSYETQSTRYKPDASKVLDGDPTSWWHSKWLDGIPDHPHHVTIDFGASQPIKALHYLPAVIINNNGMIRDYEVHVSSDGENWGEPVAQGVMINLVRIDRAYFAAENTMFFESRDYRTRTNSVLCYRLDGKPAEVIARDARILDVAGRYLLAIERKNDNETLVVFDATDPGYRFDLEPQIPRNRAGEIYIEGDRLILADRKILIADLQKKSFISPPDDNKLPHNQHGQVVRVGTDSLLKFVHQGHRGQALSKIDLRTGEISSWQLEVQWEPFRVQNFQQTRPNAGSRRLLTFDQMLLFYDGSVLGAWSG